MLDRMGCQPRLANSPFLRCVHHNESLTALPSLLLHSLCLPGCHHSTANYLQRHHFRQHCCTASIPLPCDPTRGTKSASPRPTSGLSMTDTCRNAYQKSQDYRSPQLPTGPYSLRSRFHTLDPGHSTLLQTPPLSDPSSWIRSRVVVMF